MESVYDGVDTRSVREVSYARFAGLRGVQQRAIRSAANIALRVLALHYSRVTKDTETDHGPLQ